MYKTDVAENYCSCKSWKYQSKPNSVRDCKHLIEMRGFALPPSEGYKYTKTKPTFMLLSETVPKKSIQNVEDYSFTIKYDGIRVKLNTDGELITRSGIFLSDYNMNYKPPFQLDGELCHLRKEGHVNVMKAIDQKKYNQLVMRVFDFLPAQTECISYTDRYDMLFDIHHVWPNKKIQLVAQHEFLINGSNLQQQIKGLVADCREQGFEGVVVRSKDSCYTTTGRRDNKIIFKVKPEIY